MRGRWTCAGRERADDLDDPSPTGLRYCMNSAALRFVPLERMEAGGYGRYAELFRARTRPEEAASARAGGETP